MDDGKKRKAMENTISDPRSGVLRAFSNKIFLAKIDTKLLRSCKDSCVDTGVCNNLSINAVVANRGR